MVRLTPQLKTGPGSEIGFRGQACAEPFEKTRQLKDSDSAKLDTRSDQEQRASFRTSQSSLNLILCAQIKPNEAVYPPSNKLLQYFVLESAFTGGRDNIMKLESLQNKTFLRGLPLKEEGNELNLAVSLREARCR
jgi:hypothetical protein